VAGNNEGDAVIVDQRNCGKLTNLSSMYRIGAKSLQSKFFTQYDKLINLRESTHFLNSYKKTFRGIPAYWESSIDSAKRTGYAASLSNRRFYVKPTDWKGESSAINMPIQGSGADLSELTIAILAKTFPYLIFQIQVHDSLTWLIPEDEDPYVVKKFMDDFDFNVWFDADLKIKFPLDFAYGDNLAEIKPL
jgi:DNA polymerase-1